MPQSAEFFQLSELQTQRLEAAKSYLEFLRVPAMSCGVYVIPAGGSDPQQPHQEDEFYFVLSGRARMRDGTENRSVTAGSAIFVPAGVEHRFYDVEEELTVLVVFSPAET